MFFKKLTGIMACDPNGVIGKDGQLPWHYPEDLEHFRKTTINHIMIMGHKTFLSLPENVVKSRFNIIFTRQLLRSNDENIIFVHSLEDFLSLKNLPEHKEFFVIGGSEIISLFLKNNLINEFLLTKIKKCYVGDVFFPMELIQNWPHIVLKETKDFSICKYINSRSNI